MRLAEVRLAERLVGLGLALVSFGCGGLDIISYKFLGQVFPSAMTGNMALMGLALGQDELAAATRNMTALAGFVAGVAAAALVTRGGGGKARLLLVVAAEALLLGLYARWWPERGDEETLYALIGGASMAMGMQSGVAHRIGLPSITTTYFTGTVLGLVFGVLGTAARPPRRLIWPLLALFCYVAGAAGAGWAISARAPDWVTSMLAWVPFVVTIVFGCALAASRLPGGRAA